MFITLFEKCLLSCNVSALDSELGCREGWICAVGLAVKELLVRRGRVNRQMRAELEPRGGKQPCGWESPGGLPCPPPSSCQLAISWPPPQTLHQGMPREQRNLQSTPTPLLGNDWPCSCRSWLHAALAPEELARLQKASSESLRWRENH